MKLTITAILGAGAFLALVAAASAQTTFTFSGTCAKASSSQSIPAGDRPGHAYAITRGKCTTNDEIGGAKATVGNWSDIQDVTPTRVNVVGMYVETFDSGGKVFYSYTQMLNVQAGVMTSGTATFKVAGGTGKMKGMKGSGSCTFTPGRNGTTNYTCNGSYSLAGP